MKKVFKVFSLILFMFIFIIKVSAVTITTNSTAGTVDTASRLVTNTGTLSVTDVESTDTFKCYKILDVFYNSTTNNITYEFTSTFATFLSGASGTITVSGNSKNISALTVADYQALTSGNVSNGSTTSASTLDVLLSKYAGYIKTNNTTGTAMTTSNTTASATVAAGSYLVLPTSTQSVYAVMSGNVEFSGNGSGWILNNATIVAKKSSANITKKVYDAALNEYVNVASHNINDFILFYVTLTLSTYPTNATNNTLILEDLFPAGITFSGFDDLQVRCGGRLTVDKTTGTVTNGANTVATTTFTNNTLTITFDYSELTSNTVTVIYGARLNDNATLGSIGNVNTAKMTYSNDPYGSGTTYVTDTATVYTYGIKVLKKNSNNTPLPSAEIKLCYDNACNEPFEIWDATENDFVDAIATTDANGYATFSGLESGTYYYQEVKAPNGYRLDNTVYSVTVNTSNAYTTANLVNVPLGLLPATGGIGTYIYTGVGATLIIVASVLLLKRKKKIED